MKNSLELEIINRIKKANERFACAEFQEALAGYKESMIIYKENKIYNQTISPHYQSTIFSLEGTAHIELGNLAEAEQALTSSLKTSPYHSTSLIRRAKVFLKLGRISEAIEDLENAYVGEPDNKNISDLIQETKSKVEEIIDVEEKRRLRSLLTTIYTVSEQSKEYLDEEEMLSFSTLRKIDRSSVQIRQPKKKSSMFSQFRESQSNEDNAPEDQDNGPDNFPVQIISKSKFSFVSEKKSTEKSKSSFIQEGEQLKNDIKKQRMAHSGHHQSQKSRSSVRFSKNRDSREKDFEGIQPLHNHKKENKNRKSCLRSSKIFKSEVETPKKRISTMLSIKNIDGALLSHANTDGNDSDVYTEILGAEGQGQMKQPLINKIQSVVSQQWDASSSSDSEGNQHNIYGNGYDTNNVLVCIQNLSNWPDKYPQNGSKSSLGNKKGSILRKDSLIQSSKGLRRSEKKKSVCFASPKQKSQVQMSIEQI